MMFGDKQEKNIFSKKVGSLGELIAGKYLKGRKYKILRKNYREKFDEIDIIVESKDGSMIFVEVKTLFYLNGKKENMISPEDNFTVLKFKKIKRLCEMFIAKHLKNNSKEINWRIDLIAIEVNKNENSFLIKHYKNVYK